MFYISSQGHSATGWLSRTLSMQPGIVCWHAARSIPAYGMDNRIVTAQKFAIGLIRCEEYCFSSKVFGACHGFHGAVMKPYCDEYNGVFLGLIRHPIMRINSIFSTFVGSHLTHGLLPVGTDVDPYRLAQELNPIIDDVFHRMADRDERMSRDNKRPLRTGMFGLKKSVAAPKTVEGVRSMVSRVSSRMARARLKSRYGDDAPSIGSLSEMEVAKGLCRSFLEGCTRTFVSDSEITQACAVEDILKVEEMTKSQTYFDNSIILRLIGENADKVYLTQAFKVADRINQHVTPNLDPQEVFSLWPKSFKEYYINNYESCMARKVYDQFDYHLR